MPHNEKTSASQFNQLVIQVVVLHTSRFIFLNSALFAIDSLLRGNVGAGVPFQSLFFSALLFSLAFLTLSGEIVKALMPRKLQIAVMTKYAQRLYATAAKAK